MLKENIRERIHCQIKGYMQGIITEAKMLESVEILLKYKPVKSKRYDTMWEFPTGIIRKLTSVEQNTMSKQLRA